MSFKSNKFLFYYGLLAVVVLGGVFAGGYYIGDKNHINIENISLLNKEPAVVASDAVDFAPFWKAWSILDKQYVSKKEIPNDQERVWGAISGLAESMGDPYTTFFPPDESKTFEETIAGEFSGVGMEIGLRDHSITVISPIKNTPAYNAGVKAGDKILEINGTSTIDMTVDKAVSLIRGKKGTTVTLSLSREGAKQPMEIKIVRDVIQIPTLDTEKREGGIFLIKLYTFSANSPDLFRSALREFVESGNDKLILDLRNNPGGYLEAAVDMASWFLPVGKVIVREDTGKKDSEKVFRSKGYNIFNEKLKFAVLVNQGSASAAEILAGALSEHGVAKLIGERTFGKGSVQELLPITASTSLKVTVARWLTPNGLSISEGGLKPQFEIVQTENDVKNNKDPVMEKAIELLLKNN